MDSVHDVWGWTRVEVEDEAIQDKNDAQGNRSLTYSHTLPFLSVSSHQRHHIL
jgi:hypothetical protein